MKVGYIGLGTMGGPMAFNLLKAKHEVFVHDVNQEIAEEHISQGAIWADTPAELAQQCKVVFTSLPGPTEMELVALGKNGLIDGFSSGDCYFDLTTNSPTTVRRVHDKMAQKGVHVFDAPVSGGPKGAQSGKMSLWVGGDEERFNENKTVLDAIGDRAMYVGPIGAGAIAKLVHNCSGYMMQTVFAEVFTMGTKAGLDPMALWLAVRQGAAGRRRTFDNIPDHFLSNKYDPPAFALKLAHKDVTLATELGKELGVPMRIANLTLAEMTEARNRGWDERDSRSAMLLQSERAGVEIEVPQELIDAAFEKEPK